MIFNTHVTFTIHFCDVSIIVVVVETYDVCKQLKNREIEKE
jgi:hypothetical protein